MRTSQNRKLASAILIGFFLGAIAASCWFMQLGRPSHATLLKSLGNRDPIIRRESIIALRSYRLGPDERATAKAISACLLDENISVRYAALDTLLLYFASDSLNSSLPNIATALENHPDLLDGGGFTFVAARLYGKEEETGWVLSVLARILQSDISMEHRVHAMILLTKDPKMPLQHRQFVYEEIIPSLLGLLGPRGQGEGEAFFAAVLLANWMRLRPDILSSEQKESLRAQIETLTTTDPVAFLREHFVMEGQGI